MCIRDRNNTNGQNAVNAGNAFYNFFQFKNMREATKYSGCLLYTSFSPVPVMLQALFDSPV